MIYILSQLEGRKVPHKGLLQIYENNQEIALAVLMQNCIHPKNSQRVQAVKDGTYVEINSAETARNYIKGLLKTHLEHELLAAESQVNAQIAKLRQMHDVKVLLEAPDVFVAAAALSSQKFCHGKGDRTSFFEMVLETDPNTIPDLGRKLILIAQNEFMGLKLYNDKLASNVKVNRRTIYKLWLHCCRKNKAVGLRRMIKFQPHAEEWLTNYDKFVDAEGRTTLN